MRLSGQAQLLRDFNSNHRRLTGVFFFVAGMLLMLGFAPVGWPVVAFLMLQPLLFSCLNFSPRDAAWHGFCFGAGLFLAGTYWLYISIHVFGQAPLWIAIVLMLGLVVIMGLYYALTAWSICKLSAGNAMRLLLAAPAVWVAVEWLRGWFLSGFPWMTLGYGQIDSPMAGYAPVLGVYGVSAAAVLMAAALHVVFTKQGRLRYWSLGVVVVTLSAGWTLRMQEWTEPAGKSFEVSIVQGGITQDRKWLPEQFQPTLDFYRKSLHENPHSSIIVWPEVAIPAVLDRMEEFVSELQIELARNQQTLLFGILERSEGRIFNSVVMLDGSSVRSYRKRHLVPFGETFPVPAFVREWMRLMSLPHSDMAAGDDEQPLLITAAGQKLSVAICYEDAYGAEQLYALPDATLLINVSNDAWFGDSIAPHQHLEIARMRALEAGRFVVRATNTGISGYIDARGRVYDRLPQFSAHTQTNGVYPHSGLTPYARFGNWPVISICLLIVCVSGWRLRQSSSS